ncbi:YhgE/Pip domain-containing protein [Streptomyces sp. 1222.5]|uniref:YhgE/Pip domain-containing protein n=1 Tax=Streptomyces sp. 1222.5 TaxID=1881026 RepID=UPI003EB7ABB5
MKAARLAWLELQRFRGRGLQWVPVALVLLPLMAAMLCWASVSNPQGRFSHVPAAIVNLDETARLPAANGGGTTTIKAGQRLVEDLTLRRTFAWRELNEHQASQQLKAGDVYFVLVIPKKFSSAIAGTVQNKDSPAASLVLQLDDANGYLVGTAASAEAGSLTEQVTTLALGYMAQQTTDVWKDVRTGLDKALNTDVVAQGDEQGAPKTSSGVDQLAASLSQAATAMSQINDIVQTAKTNSGAMASQLNNAAASAQSAQDNAGSNNPALLQQSTSQANTSVRLAQNSVTGLDGQLQSATSTTKSLLDQITVGSQNAKAFSNQIGALRQQLQKLAQSIPPSAPADDDSKTVHQIVTVQQHNLHPSKTLGRGMAPLALSLTCAVTVLTALSVLRPFNNRVQASTLNSFTAAQAGWLPLATVTALATCGLFLCAQALMDVFAVSIWATLAICTLASLSFASMGHLLKVAFGILGEALLLLITALQFGAAGGLYPVETTNALFINAHPYLPMTYAVEALRVTIYGGQADHLWRAVAMLAALTISFLVVSSLVLSRRRQWTAERLSSPFHQRYN